MQLRNAWVIGKREFLTRFKTKGFWIATVAFPLLMAASLAVPTLVMAKNRTDQRLAVVDATGAGLGEKLKAALTGEPKKGEGRDPANIRFDVRVLPAAVGDAAQATQRADLDRQVLAEKLDAWVWMTEKGLADNHVEYHSQSLSNWLTQSVLSRRVTEVVGDWRLRQAGFDAVKVGDLTHSLDLSTIHVAAGGSRAEGGMGAFILAIALFFMLYMILVFYGQQVMQGALEEKSSRVIEVLTSAVAPTELMAGKLGGLCALALIQVSIWIGTAAVLTSSGLLAAKLAMDFPMPTLSPLVVVNFFILFFLGFLLFSTIYLMIGSAFNSLQEAQQVAGPAIMLIVAPFFFFTAVINAPDSTLAVVTSLIPFFTPLVMMLRIAVKVPPLWQILTAYGLCSATIALMIWLCARIYRVGILMYGKKPTIQEIWRWVRYS
jgi:ABC-2 type transport system permease protein